ncbi:YeiH family protein [Streptosporangium sp. NBC_01756]|uniref:YeiH family protein n=1 Tax=Streptosporangium sp. NBC_01756 TaxID=2975950 RepID=UPI002DD888DC|nr:putative sulfate exporter family transporter [Streptosporangium sp. NBC_01756]WSC87535.1 putative sulfate exporter family transporter [Streptosporangium sp. NBC_01756]
MVTLPLDGPPGDLTDRHAPATEAASGPHRPGTGPPTATPRPGTGSPAADAPERGPRKTVRRATAEIGALLPGLAVAAAAVGLSTSLSRVLPGVGSTVVAVVCGVALTNLGGLHRSLRPGLRFAARRLLRLAIVLLGLGIALPEVLALGWRALMVIAAATGGTFLATQWIGGRIGVGPRRSLLIATGVSVCGAAAVAAMHEVAGSDDDDVAGAVGVVVLYGSATIVVLPPLARLLGLTEHQFGMWAGASVHEVAQVAAIGAAAGAGVLTSAVVVKLARVVLLAPIVGLTSAALRRTAPVLPAGGPQATGAGRRPPVMPLFVVGFVAMVIARSAGVVPAEITQRLPEVTGMSLTAALFGLGTGVNLRELARGGRSLLLGGLATVLIGVVSLLGVLVVG